MKERPIIFSAPMVRALLAGTKTQTRRIVKPSVKGCTVGTYTHNGSIEPVNVQEDGDPWTDIPSPYGAPGDQLRVRETHFAWGRWETRYSAKKSRDEWHFVDMTLECGHEYAYAADGHSFAPHQRTAGVSPCWWKRPAIFMPRAASRINLEVTGVRVERLQDISEADALAEGIVPHVRGGWHWHLHNPSDLDDWHQFGFKTAAYAYESLQEKINGPGSWAANPWGWVVEFKRVAT